MSNKKSDSNLKNESVEKIQVIVRCRPLSKKESMKNELPVVECNENERSIKISKTNENYKVYDFDKVFGPGTTQKTFYNDAISPIVEEALKGYNCTILLYGQKGSGKTYTLEGIKNKDSSLCSTSECGIIYRSVQEIFEVLEQKKTDHFIRVSHLEIYNENLRDLLKSSNSNLRLYKDEKKNICVYNLSSLRINNSNDICKILERSSEEKKLSESRLNPSRSHYIFSLVIHIKEISNDGEYYIKVGRLNFVEVADSESLSRSDKLSSRKQESGNINRGLITFGRVINSLIENSVHIPYRESKFTQLLQESLGGKNKTCIIATIRSSASAHDAIINTLEFASKARNIVNKPRPNPHLPQEELIREYREELSSLQSQLESLKRKDGVYISQERYNEINEEINKYKNESKNLEEKIEEKEKELKELICVLEANSKDIEMKDSYLLIINEKIVTTENELNNLRNQLDINNSKLEELQHILREHQFTEERAKKEYQIILNTLKTTIEDINKLFQKITRKDDLESYNANTFNMLKENLLMQLETTNDQLKDYMKSSSEYHSNMKTDISQFCDEKSNLLHKLKNILYNDEEKLTEHFRRVKDEYTSNENSIAQILTQIKKKQLGILNEDISIQDAFSQQSSKIIEALCQTIDERFDELCKLQDSSQKQLMDSLNTITSFSNQQKSNVHNIKDVFGKIMSDQNNKLIYQNEILQSYLKASLREVSLFRESTMKFMSDILNDFASQYLENIQKQIEIIYKKLDHSESVKDSGINQFDSLIEEASEFFTSMNELKNDEINTYESIRKLNDTKFSQEMDSLSSIMDKINEYSHKESILTQSTLDKVDLKYRNLSVLDEINGRCGDKLLDIKNDIREMKDQLTLSLLNYMNDLKKHKESLEVEFDVYSHNIVNNSTTPMTQLELSKEKIKSFQLHQCGHTGETPIKRNFEYPNILNNFKKGDILEEQNSQHDKLNNKRNALREITNNLICK